MRELRLRAGSAPGRPDFLSAASGLILAGDQLCVVADDELHLARFPMNGSRPGSLLRLLPGSLPTGKERRKRLKPDLEVLLRIPACPEWPRGALLALGSGSRPHRCRGAWIALREDGRAAGRAHVIDAAPLYSRLSEHVDGLNIEGGWIREDSLFLLHRGNRGGAPNALVRFALRPLLASLRHDAALPGLAPLELRLIELPQVDGVSLGFTDATPLPDGCWLFSAVAEDTSDAYRDGAFSGAAIGMVDRSHRLRWLRRVDPSLKIEGIEVDRRHTDRVLLVTDADDPRVPALLACARLR